MAVDGVATFSDLTLDQLGGGYTLQVSGAGLAGEITDAMGCTSGEATLAFGDLNFTYNGSAQAAQVTIGPEGLDSVTVAYSRDGVPVDAPTAAGSYTVTASLDNPNYTAQGITGTMVIAPATPSITWGETRRHRLRHAAGGDPARRDGLRPGYVHLHRGRSPRRGGRPGSRHR